MQASATFVRSASPGQSDLPSATATLRFIIFGITALLLGAGCLIWRPDLLATYHYNQYVIAVTHLFTLGWITAVVMGAMYQLVPVALETKLHNERLLRWQFFAHVVGTVGMVCMFWIWNMKQVGHFGSIMGLSIGMFVYNLARTLVRIPKWNAVAFAIASALFWLAITMLAGLYLAASKCWSFSPFAAITAMHAHAHLGVLGVFVIMIAGVSYKLVPMFAVSEIQNQRRAWSSIAVLNAALAGLFVTMLLSNPWKLAFAFLAVVGLAIYGWELLAILRARKRQHLDWALRYFLTGIGLIIPLSLLGLGLAWPGVALTEFVGQLENVYGFIALLGVVTFAMLGMMYKIVPFLVWQSRYSHDVGRRKVPMLADLYSVRLQASGYWIYLAGLAAASVATALGNERAIRWSCVLLWCGLALFAVNMLKILAHLKRSESFGPVWRSLARDVA